MMTSEIFLSLISITLLILLLLAVIVITFFISGRQRLQQRVVLAETKINFEKEIRVVETEVTESIMGQFAHELHDNIGQLLTALHIQVENQKIDFPELIESFKPTEIYIAEIHQQLRMLSRTLNNDYIGHIGLLSALNLEIDRINNLKRFQAHIESPSGSSGLEKNQELMVFRIFQEITQNALRHANAKNLYVKVKTNGDGFKLEVRDDGKGFDTEAILNSNKASGIRNIMKRAQLAGLSLEINSTPDKGSLFIIKKTSILA